MSTAMSRDSLESGPMPTVGPKLLETLWRRKSLVLFGVVVGIVAGYFKFAQEAPIFEASSQILLLKRHADPTSSTGGRDSRDEVIEDYVATQESLIQSHEVLYRAAEKLKGRLLQPPAGDFIAHIALGLKVSRPREAAYGAGSSILNISYRGPCAEDCPTILNAVIDAYRDSIDGDIGAVTKEGADMIKKGRDEAKKRLDACLAEYEKIRTRMSELSLLNNTDLKARINLNEGKRSELLLRKVELESRVQLLQEGIDAGKDRSLLLSLFEMTSPARRGGASGGGVEVSRLREDALLELKIRENELLTKLGEDHPDIIAIRMRHKALMEASLSQKAAKQADGKAENQPEKTSSWWGRMAWIREADGKAKGQPNKTLGDGLDLYMQILRQEVAVIDLQCENLDDLLEDDREVVQKLDQCMVKESNVAENRDYLRKQVANFEERKHHADLMSDAPPIYEARVITPAPTGAKIGPILISTLAMASAIGFALGAALAFFAEKMDKNFRSVEDVRDRLGLTVIGDIPALVAHEPAEIADRSLDPLLVVHHLPKSVQAETYRGVRTSLYFSTQGKGHQVIQITSANPGDGKSTLSSNLAVSIAQSGKRVILIDADFRKPRVHKIFGVSADVGLASVIAGETLLPAAIQQSVVPGLDILPCGPRPTNPADLLSSALFEDILGEIKKNYDFVLIDTPPILVVSDASAVVPRVDGVILTVRMRANSRTAAQYAKDQLSILGANVLGVVVNGTEEKHRRYGYGYGYGYRNGYKYTYQAIPYGEDVENSGKLTAPK